jgi:ribosome-binding protein aMBF1 (putative translation factor)
MSARANERAGKSEFMEWLDGELEKDPEFRRRVDEALSEMRIEQDLVALREARGLSQSDLAKRIGVSQPLIARLESGRVKNLTLRTLARYAAGVGAQVRLQVVKDAGGQRGAKMSQKVVPLKAVRARA